MPQPVTRRAVLGGMGGVAGGLAGGSVLLGGCSAGGASVAEVPRDRTRDQLDPDEAAVADLVVRLTTAVGLLERTGRRFPVLVAPLAATLGAERAHLALLRRSARAADLPRAGRSSTGPTERPRTDRGAALTAARQSTASLRAAYFSAAARAESGSFARLLASMGCALTQRLPEITL